MNTELIQEAIPCLNIQGVYLRNAQLQQVDGFDPMLSQDELLVQFRATARRVNHVEIKVADSGESQRLFKVDFECGLRLAEPARIQGDDPASGTVVEITATFVAEYLVKPGSDPSKAALEAFAGTNVGYHVWPYWREYLQSTCARAGLPVIALPMYTVPKEHQAAPKKMAKRSKKTDKV